MLVVYCFPSRSIRRLQVDSVIYLGTNCKRSKVKLRLFGRFQLFDLHSLSHNCWDNVLNVIYLRETDDDDDLDA